MYTSNGSSNWDFSKCLLLRGCLPFRGVCLEVFLASYMQNVTRIVASCLVS